MRSALPLSHVRRFALGAAAALAIACATFGGERQAAAQIVEVAPPAVRVEVIPPAPPQHFWIAGYWGWHGGRHVWMPGRYERVRPGWGYERAHWAHERHGWHLAPGRWHRR
ncbi:MAG TPA: hypothetical protein VGI39_13980 [Polyangiaceae bacterium]